MRGVLMTIAGVTACVLFFACGSDDVGSAGPDGTQPDGAVNGPDGGVIPTDGAADGTTPLPASCAPAGGSATVSTPTISIKLADDGSESWMASPAVADVDGDGQVEIIVARGGTVFGWKAGGMRVLTFDTGKDRIWASPAVGDFAGDDKLEIAVAARNSTWLIDAAGNALTGFPVEWGTETRTLATGDVDGDGKLDVVAGVHVTGDVVRAYKADGTTVAGFPPVASGASGCSTACYFAGLYDQNLAIGDLDGDGKQDLVLPHDNAYVSIFKGTGAAFDANAMFTNTTKTPGVRYLHALSEAQQGYSDDEPNAKQGHFTNTPPAIADIDGDGKPEIVMVGSVQNAAQTDRKRGVALWVVRSDASRLPGWETPFEVPAYVMGLADGFAAGLNQPAIPGAGNLVGLTNQVTVAEIDKGHAGLEMIFAGFDGRIHAVAADKTELWSTPYAENGRALTGGIVVADLSADGVPEIVFATYSPDQGGGALFVLGANGALLHKVPLPQRGAMAVPTIADVNGDGTLEIVVSLKDAEPSDESVHVFTVASSKSNCVLWPTGRGNLLRNAWVR